MYLEDVLEILLEEQIIHVLDEEGEEYFHGYRGNLNEEIPLPRLKVTGLFANYDRKQDIDDLEIMVREQKNGKGRNYGY